MADSQRKTANLASNILINNTSAQYATILMFDADLEADTTYTLSFTASANIRMYMSEAIFTQATYLRTVEGVNTVTVTTKADLVKTSSNYQNGRWLVAKNTVEQSVSIDITNVMLNTGSTALPYEPYGWLHSLRKLTTATEAVENPLYSDGTAITAYTIKGNTVQNGTPTPSAPVDVNGVGVRTENLWNPNQTITRGYYNDSGALVDDITVGHSELMNIGNNTTFTINNLWYYEVLLPNFAVYEWDSNKQWLRRTYRQYPTSEPITFTVGNNTAYISLQIKLDWGSNGVMLNTGSTAKPYEPYGYKIPISSAGQTTNVYLGEVQTTRKIKKIVFDGTENWSNQNVGQHGALSIRKDELPLSPDMPAGTLNILSTHFKAISNSPQLDIGNMVAGGSYLNFDYDGTNNLTDFKAFLAAQYANGTPVTVWYVLQNATTAAVNEPLMKIGTYADTLSNATAIPTTDGANSITVDTTVQPSEFSATWTGWHDASVKEKSENLFDTFDIVGQVPSISNGQLITYNGSTTSLIPINSGNITVTKPPTALLYLLLYAADMSYIGYVQNSTDANFYGSSVTGYENAKYCRLRIDRTTGLNDIQIMLNTGSTALPYEPYWK